MADVSMTDKHTLVERLNAIEHCYAVPVCRLAATRITALEAEKAELVDALEPLARKKIPSNGTGNAGAYSIYHSDIRRARATLAKARQS